MCLTCLRLNGCARVATLHAVCCSVLQCVAVFCSAIQQMSSRLCVFPGSEPLSTTTNEFHPSDALDMRDVTRASVIRPIYSVLQCVAVCCSVLQCVAVRCSAL